VRTFDCYLAVELSRFTRVIKQQDFSIRNGEPYWDYITIDSSFIFNEILQS